MIVIGVPISVVGIGGAINWILAHGEPNRDYFLLGVELVLAAMALCFTTIFDWIRRVILSPGKPTTEIAPVNSNPDVASGISTPDLAPLIFAVSVTLVSVVALLFIVAMMGAYLKANAQPSISWGWWLVINLLGAIPLGTAAALLLGSLSLA